eukprot:1240640-Pleurochrysis_carterae.AAC.2
MGREEKEGIEGGELEKQGIESYRVASQALMDPQPSGVLAAAKKSIHQLCTLHSQRRALCTAFKRSVRRVLPACPC